MKNIRNFLLLTLTTVLFLSFSNAQDKMVSGIVTAFDGLPVLGAEVEVNSSKQTVLTDTLGRFIVPVEYEDKLKVTANGFYNQNIKLTENTQYAAINLKARPSSATDIVGIGYDYVSESDKLTAASLITDEDVNFSQYATIQDAIKGRLSGVQIQNNGEIFIRGNSTITGSNAALIVIDGVTSDYGYLNSISPSEVKSVSVVKDGSAAIYGTRGSNGVVIVQTK